MGAPTQNGQQTMVKVLVLATRTGRQLIIREMFMTTDRLSDDDRRGRDATGRSIEIDLTNEDADRLGLHVVEMASVDAEAVWRDRLGGVDSF